MNVNIFLTYSPVLCTQYAQAKPAMLVGFAATFPTTDGALSSKPFNGARNEGDQIAGRQARFSKPPKAQFTHVNEYFGDMPVCRLYNAYVFVLMQVCQVFPTR